MLRKALRAGFLVTNIYINMDGAIETQNLVLILYLPIILVLFGLAIFIFFYIRNRKIKADLLRRADHLVMLQVLIPKGDIAKEGEAPKNLKEIIAVAEQLYASCAALKRSGMEVFFYGQPEVSFELVAKDREIIFFVGVRKEYQELIEKQIMGFYPDAQVEPSTEFRIFDKDKKAAVAVLKLTKKDILPIKTYQYLESDPLGNITNVLSKLDDRTKATIQLLIRPLSNEQWKIKVQETAKKISEGESVSFYSQPTVMKGLSKAGEFGGEVVSSLQTKPKPAANAPAEVTQEMKRLTPQQEETLKALNEKVSKSAFEAQLRFAVVSESIEQAQFHLQNIVSAYAQFSSPNLNSFKTKIIDKKGQFLVDFIIRCFSKSATMILNAEELSSLFHFPNKTIETSNIRWLRAKRAPAPANLPEQGIILGENIYRDQKQMVRIKDEDRRRHLYAIGMTGTGKSTLFENMCLQDIKEDRGVCFIDPHGDTVESILSKVPQSRIDDVVYFDPGNLDHPYGLNLLEWHDPHQKDFLVQETVAMFYKLFDPTGQGIVGPQFEHWMRNAALTLMDQPGGGTLIEIPRLFTDDAFRGRAIGNLRDPVVKAFWEKQLAKTAEFHKSEMYNYFISKFGRFMTNEMMRNIIGQTHSSFDFAQIMDQGKILLVNLSKGKVGEMNANLLGMIMVTKLYAGAMARQSIEERARRDFYLYVDEFQNLATDTFASILSEARKYHLNLVITNQYIAQLSEVIRDAVIGNIGTSFCFRIGPADAEFMEKVFTPVFSESDLINIEKYNAYIKLLIDNTPSIPFSLRTLPSPYEFNPKRAKLMAQLSSLKYAKDRNQVEKEIKQRVENIAIPATFGDVPRENL